MSNQHTGLPNTPEEIRAFIGKNFSSLQFGQETEQPHENDTYTLTAHDLISAFQWFEIDAPVSAEPVAVPKGWRLVPVSPTKEMLLAGETNEYNTEIWWDLMLAAAPAATVAAQPDVTQQTLDDVKAGIPARDAEIEALQKRNKDLLVQAVEDIAVIHRLGCRLAEISEVVTPDVPLEQHDTADLLDRVKKAVSAQAQQAVSGADGLPASPTQGMTLGQRIAHVGGRENAQGYVEFGSPMAVNALIQHVLRDFHRQGRVNLSPAQQDTDKVDGALAEMVHAMFRSANSIPVTRITIDRKQYEAAIDAARKEPDQ